MPETLLHLGSGLSQFGRTLRAAFLIARAVSSRSAKPDISTLCRRFDARHSTWWFELGGKLGDRYRRRGGLPGIPPPPRHKDAMAAAGSETVRAHLEAHGILAAYGTGFATEGQMIGQVHC